MDLSIYVLLLDHVAIAKVQGVGAFYYEKKIYSLSHGQMKRKKMFMTSSSLFLQECSSMLNNQATDLLTPGPSLSDQNSGC